jgi:DNA polymerase-3 subunit epsilon
MLREMPTATPTPAGRAPRGHQALAAALNALLAAGFVPDGHTLQEQVRIPTSRSPVYGQSGGELATLGGRQRLALPGTNVKATVGPRTLALYRVEGQGLDGVAGIASLATSDLAAIERVLAGIVNEQTEEGHMPAHQEDLFATEAPREESPAQGLGAALQLVRQAGYAVLRPLDMDRFEPRPQAQGSVDGVHVAVIDTETTGDDSEVDEAIEIAGHRLALAEDGSWVVVDRIEMLREPSRPITAGAQRVHGLGDGDVAGKSFDLPRLQRFFGGCHFAVAHNATFDWNILQRGMDGVELPVFACSQSDIPWHERFGYSSRALEYLAFKSGFTYSAHRALGDTAALTEVISGSQGAWDDLMRAAMRSYVEIWAVGSPFETKDALKANGYAWHDPSVRIPLEGDPGFQSKATTDSTARRPPIPEQSDRGFQTKAT